MVLTESEQTKGFQAYIDFFEALFELPTNLEQFMPRLSEALQKICPLLRVSEVELCLDAPSTKLAPEGVNRKKTVYKDGMANRQESYIQKIETDEGGTAFLKFYPIEGEFWGEEEKKWLDLIAEMLFVYAGRARMGSLLTKALQTDMMTGLPNITEFVSHGNRLIGRGLISEYSAVYYNVRNFKYVNQIVAYHNGNEVMVQYAQKAAAIIEGEEILARLGGDNYIALVRKERLDDFLDYMNHISVEVATPGGVKQIPLGIRAGIYIIPEQIHHIGEAITGCSVALQEAKQDASADFVYYTEELSRKIMQEKQVQVQFEQALKKKEFIAFLQPKVDMKTGRICGAEALARWIHEGQIVPPIEFIPVLERDGSICQLDFEILRQACEYIKKWVEEGKKPVRISVNISRLHLTNEHFMEQLIGIVDAYQIDHKYLEVELTETANYEQYGVMQDIFAGLKKAGFSTSIDDFGTGYSSLTLLKRLEVDVLKLDKSFLWELDRDDVIDIKERIVIRNVISMANELGIKVLAEGVETMKQRDFLLENSCNLAQGFLYAKPMSIEEFEKSPLFEQ